MKNQVEHREDKNFDPEESPHSGDFNEGECPEQEIEEENVAKEKKEFFEAIKKIAIPVMLQNLLFVSLNFVDSLMVGSLGKYQFSGVGLGGQYYFIVNLSTVGIVSACQIYMSQYFGAKKYKDFRHAVGLALTSAIVVGILFSLVAILMPEFILGLFSKDPEVVRQGAMYIRIAAFQYPIFAIVLPLAVGSRTSKNAKLPLRISFVTLVLNTTMNYIFIFGKLGFPEMGVRGAAMATVLSSLISLTQYIILLKKKEGPLNAPLSDFFSFSRNLFIKVIKTGWTVILHEVLWSVGLSVFVLVFSRTSTDGYTAYQIAMQFIRLMFIMAFGISNAAVVTIGAQLGHNKINKAIRFEKKFSKFQFLLSILSAFIVVIVSYLAIDLFNVEQGIKTMAMEMIFILILFMPFKFYNGLEAAGILRAGGDTKIPPLIEVGAMYFVKIPVLYIIINYFHVPYTLALAITSVGDVAVSFLLYRRVKSQIWAKNLVKE